MNFILRVARPSGIIRGQFDAIKATKITSKDGVDPGTKNTHRYRHRGLKTADLESRRELSLSFLALITQLFP